MADLTLLDLLDRLPAPSHRGDPATSREAAAKVRVGPLCRKVLAALYRAGDYGATDQELGISTGLTATSAGTRRLELARLGLVEVVEGVHRLTEQNNRARVHRLTAAGREVASELSRTW